MSNSHAAVRDGAVTADATPAPASYRAARVLQGMARHGRPVTLTVIARDLALPKSSVSNVLVSLAATGLVRRIGRGWVLGYAALELSRAALTSTDVVAEFHRFVSGSRTLVGETVLLAVLDGMDVVYVARHDGHQPVRYINEIGTRAPAVVTALGRAMLAGLPRPDLEQRLGGTTDLPVRTPRSLRTVPDLVRDLEQVRERGHAVDTEQGVAGVGCFGVAVDSWPPTAVSVSFLADRATDAFETGVVADLAKLAVRLARAESASHPSPGRNA